ncbi:MAG: Snf7 family protein [Nitrososphaerales archaeon]
MANFIKKWKKSESRSFREKVKDAVRPEEPLGPMIENAIRQIRIQIAKLDSACVRLKDRGLKIFNEVVSAVQRQDLKHASMFANELAEVRKMNKMVTQAKLALEQIVLRLDTVKDLGDITLALSPAISVARSIRSELSEITPEAEREIGEISSLLSEIVVSASQTSVEQISFEAINEDAEKIIAEASTVAEQKVKEIFPELPEPLTQTIEEKASETA